MTQNQFIYEIQNKLRKGIRDNKITNVFESEIKLKQKEKKTINK